MNNSEGLDSKEEKEVIRKPNIWLENTELISKIQIDDTYYIDNLIRSISNLVKSTPVPVISSLNIYNSRIYFMVGKDNKKSFEIDNNIHVKDWITLVKRWLSQFYPQYEIDVEVEESLSDEEVWKKVNEEKMKLDDALLLKKISKKKEKGMIIDIQITNDEFILRVNNEKFVRMSGTLDRPLILSQFLKQIRKIENPYDIKDFIFSNSTEIKKVESNLKVEQINYSGTKMMNFFIINYPDLRFYELQREGTTNTYIWDKYRITFDSHTLEDDCVKYVKEKQMEDGIILMEN